MRLAIVLVAFVAGCTWDRGCRLECLECASVKMDCRAQGEPVKVNE